MAMKAPSLLGIVLLSLIVLVACGGSDPTAKPPPTPTPTSTSQPTPTAVPTLMPPPGLAPTPGPILPPSLAEGLSEGEIAYLDQVHEALGLFGDKARHFGDLFNQTYAVRERLFEALEDAGAGTAFEDTAEALERLVPPQIFQADNERMVQTARELVRVDSQIIDVLADQDAVAFFVINAELAEVSGMGGLDLSPAVCNAAAGPDMPRPVPGCGSGEALPGGEYGAQLKGIIGRFNAKFSGRSLVVFLPPV